MADALNRYGRRRTMSQHMQEEAPLAIVQKCLEASDGTPLGDIAEILRHRCSGGCEPGSSKGPNSWGWFPTVIANEIRSRRQQAAATQDPSRKKHWSDYRADADPELERSASTFSTLDDLEATA